MERPQISVVIPLFNEEDERPAPLLDELFAELSKLGRTHEVICVDDGSSRRDVRRAGPASPRPAASCA